MDFGHWAKHEEITWQQLFEILVTHRVELTPTCGCAPKPIPTDSSSGATSWSIWTIYLLVVDHEPQQVIMHYMALRYMLKPGSVMEQDSYLGSQISKFCIDGAEDPDKPRWAMSLELYVKQAVADIETELDKVDKYLPKRVTTPMAQGYHPELDASHELNAKWGQYYQSLIGVLRWICELGCLDILVTVSMLSRFVVSPRGGHLQQLFHIFAYLKHHTQSKMVFDDSEPT
jgi:hypothetical protein